MYLAGDIGGTKTHLALYQDRGGKSLCIKDQKFPSQEFADLETIVKEFLKGEVPEKACFGIAGPVKNGKSQATNLPWLIDASHMSKSLGIKKISLINDLEANAYGIRLLSEDEIVTLNVGDPKAMGNQALVSPGTGLGEAGIFFDGDKHWPFACEGGHTDFAPRNELEDELLDYLRNRFNHVSYERILSGPGLCNLYQFFIDTKKEEEDHEILQAISSRSAPHLITEKGVAGTSRACVRALELFVSIYGSEAGNTALKLFALGGVYLGGGIAPKIVDTLKTGEFMESFTAKGRFQGLLSSIPVYIVLNDSTALLGAMFYCKNVM